MSMGQNIWGIIWYCSFSYGCVVYYKNAGSSDLQNNIVSFMMALPATTDTKQSRISKCIFFRSRVANQRARKKWESLAMKNGVKRQLRQWPAPFDDVSLTHHLSGSPRSLASRFWSDVNQYRHSQTHKYSQTEGNSQANNNNSNSDN